MRWTEHLHMLVQLFGFSHPQDFFRGSSFKDTFRSVWSFVASIVFESQEAFAAYLGTAATEALQKEPLMEIKSAQKKVMSIERTAASIQAQRLGRGLTETQQMPCTPSKDFLKWTLRILTMGSVPVRTGVAVCSLLLSLLYLCLLYTSPSPRDS